MTFLILMGEDDHGTIDMEAEKIRIGSMEMDLKPNSVVKPGDEVLIRGKKYTVMRPVPALFEIVSQKGFQTVKIKDASYMIAMSSIRSGSNVLESGCGTGSLSVNILWQILPDGKLTSVDRSEKAIEIASRNIEKFGLRNLWNPVCGDIKDMSFHDSFDAVFLDIPDPWECIPEIVGAIKHAGTLITYLPNFNQLEKTVLTMKKSNLKVIESLEISKRNIIVRDGMTRPDSTEIAHTAFITVAIRKSGFTLPL